MKECCVAELCTNPQTDTFDNRFYACECNFLHLDFASVAELNLKGTRHFEKKRNFHASHQLLP
jgi:hypothetical protein